MHTPQPTYTCAGLVLRSRDIVTSDTVQSIVSGDNKITDKDHKNTTHTNCNVFQLVV